MIWDHADKFRAKLARGQTCLGTVISFTDPTVTEALCQVFDFVWIDMEHNALSLEAVQGHVMATKGSETVPLVRVPWNDPVLDQAGARHRRRGRDRAAGSARRRTPAAPWPHASIRRRGSAGSGRDAPSHYGQLGRTGILPRGQPRASCRSSRSSTSRPSRISMRSSPCRGWRASSSVRHDLAGSMGLMGQPRHPDVLRAIDTVIARCPPGGRPDRDRRRAMIPRFSADWIARGVQLARRWAAIVQPPAPGGGPGGRPGPRADRFCPAGDTMKITQLETLRLPEHPNIVWVQIHTADGLVGLGETYHVPGAVEAVIHDYAAPFFLGQSAFDRERHWQNFFSYANFFGHAGAEMRAISALDIALWDLLGQYLGQPIYNLIGGRCRESIPIYNTCVNTPKYADQDAFLNEPGELARSLLKQGIRQMKVWPWDRFAPQLQFAHDTGPAGWTAVGPPGHHLSPEDLQRRLVDRPGDPQGGGRPDADRDRGAFALGPELRDPDRAGPRALRRRLDGRHHPARQRRRPGPPGARDPRPAGGERAPDDPLRLPRAPRARSRPHHHAGRGLDRRDHRGAQDRHPGRYVSPGRHAARLHRAGQRLGRAACLRRGPECDDPGDGARLLSRAIISTFSRDRYRFARARPTFDLGPGLGAQLRPEVLSRPDLHRRVSSG